MNQQNKTALYQLEQHIRMLGHHSKWLHLENIDPDLTQVFQSMFDQNKGTNQAQIQSQASGRQVSETDNPPQTEYQISYHDSKDFVDQTADKPDSSKSVETLDPLAAQSLDSLRFRLKDCDRCNLWETRKMIVFGQGNINADLVFVGEGPGGEEDRSGLAFVGKAGRLLTQIIQSIGISRESVFICNVVKCRPPGNRNPNNDEIFTCSPFLFRQLELLKPRLIVTLGNIATKTLIPDARGIMKMRGKLTQFRDTPLLPTFHPSYLLRNPSALALVWDDMRLVRQTLFT